MQRENASSKGKVKENGLTVWPNATSFDTTQVKGNLTHLKYFMISRVAMVRLNCFPRDLQLKLTLQP